MPGRDAARGFTLIELVAVIVISAVVAVMVWQNISRPVASFVALERRARLVDAADTALARMSRELRLALPNSPRVAGGTAVEILRTLNGGRYRADPDSSGAGDTLSFTANADSFDVLGPLLDFGSIAAGAGSQADCLDGTSDCLVVYNTGQPAVCGAFSPGANAWCGDNIAGIASVAPGSIGFDNSDLAGWRFPFRSPRQRFHIVDTPVSFVCDPAAGELRRHAGYPISPVQAVPPAGGEVQLLATRVSACSFRYDPGSATRSGLITLRLALSEAGESVTLLQQVHVPNLP